MANTNTIKQLYGQGSLLYPQIAPLGNATTETAFTINSNLAAAGFGGTGDAALTSLVAETPLGGNSIWDYGRMFKVRIAGIVTGGTSTDFHLACYQVPYAIKYTKTATVLANDNLIVSTDFASGSPPSASFTGTGQFWMELTMQWDSTSGKLGGIYEAFLHGALIPRTAFTPISVTADTELAFLFTGIFSVGNAKNTAIVYEQVAEQI